MLSLLFWTMMARAETVEGKDEFGRPCALRVAPTLGAQIEGEWFDRARRPKAGGRFVAAELRSRDDGGPAEIEVYFAHGRPAWFTLRLPSATGYAHVCRL